MTQDTNPQFIGFPEGLISRDSHRLPVLYFDSSLIILEKPKGVLPDADSWHPSHKSLIQGLQSQHAANKPELEKYNISALKSVFFLEPNIHGAAMIAINNDSAETLRNAYGSDAFTFKFSLISKNKPEEEEISCDLPILPAPHSNMMKVSHKHGKKASTQFKYIEPIGDFHLWEVTTNYLRPHLVRIHAAESGLLVPGESLYNSVPQVYLSELKPGYRPKDEEFPIFSGPTLYLNTIIWPNASGESTSVAVPAPKKWQVLTKYLVKFSH